MKLLVHGCQPVNPDPEALAAEQRNILDAQEEYFGAFIRERRKRPGEDMISAMVQAEALPSMKSWIFPEATNDL